jgi:hypothetical protein
VKDQSRRLDASTTGPLAGSTDRIGNKKRVLLISAGYTWTQERRRNESSVEPRLKGNLSGKNLMVLIPK